MAAKSTTHANSLLKLIYQAIAYAGLADNAASAPVTNLSVALHTSSPGAGGNQSTSEIAYTGYARVNVVRSAVGWTVTGNSVSPTSAINFGSKTAGTDATVTHVSVGTGVSNAMLHYGTLTPALLVQNGVAPQIPTTSAITEE